MWYLNTLKLSKKITRPENILSVRVITLPICHNIIFLLIQIHPTVLLLQILHIIPRIKIFPRHIL